MKIQQIHLKNGLDSSKLEIMGSMQPKLVLVFGGASYFESGDLGQQLKSFFPQAVVIGCSSAGEIVNDGAVYDDTLVLTAVAGEDISFFSASAHIGKSEASLEAGRCLGKGLSGHNIKSVFVLAPGLDVNGSDLAKGLAEEVGSTVVVTGGLAGDGGKFQKTYTLLNETVFHDSAVVIGIQGDALDITYGSAGGWTPFGLERKVTKSVSNILYELDGQPALSLYKEYLGERAKELPASGLFYPFSILQEGATKGAFLSGGLVRTILNIDEAKGSLILAGDIPEGSVVQLMHAQTDGLVRGASHAGAGACAAVPSEQPSLGILVSCVGRKLVMGPDVDEEVDAVKTIFGPQSVITGFYSYGEICAFDRTDHRPCLHNQTMTVTRIGKAG